MARTKKEISRQVEGLKAMKKRLPEISFFGDNNWEAIDAQLDVLEGIKEANDFEDADDGIQSEAEKAEDWMNEVSDDDLFDEE